MADLILRNQEFCNETINVKQTIERSFLELGKRLLFLQEKQWWKPVYESFDDFLMELKISRATASKLINIYRTFILIYSIPESEIAKAGGWSIIAEVLPYVKSKRDALNWLRKAQILSKQDLRRELVEKRKNSRMIDCPHTNAYYLRICKDCGERSEHIHEK